MPPHQLTTGAHLGRLLLQIVVAAADVEQWKLKVASLATDCDALGVDMTPGSRTPGVTYYDFGEAAHAVVQLRWAMGRLAMGRTALSEAERSHGLTTDAMSELDFSCMCMRPRRRTIARHRCLVCFGWSF